MPIITAKIGDPALTPVLLADMFSFRARVFSQQLGWERESDQGRDNLDDLNPVYVISLDHGRVNGCLRLLPTDGWYMLGDEFPELLWGEQPPRSPVVWEVSRFAAQEINAPCESSVQIASPDIAWELILSAMRFALNAGVETFVAVASTDVESYLKSVGLRMRRFGLGHQVMVSGCAITALKINVTASLARIDLGTLSGNQHHAAATQQRSGD
ncbi:MAG: acyl-homoserine-lactone synthase AbaI [Gammaproteobacteria bacterium]|nr:MAG: acyl-homoserine-lactone synthase AbaI [Gammaproteobacteria bacterium]